MKMIKLINAALALAVLAVGTLALSVEPVRAHGERAQEPFLRMRSVQWYDVQWHPTTVAVNETMTLSGKFRLSPERMWPQTLAKPEVAFLNISHPGPVFVRKSSFVNGVNMANSTSFQLGRDYVFEIKLRAREPGRWHVHTMMNVQLGGAIVGPGKFVEITGKRSDFTNPVTTMMGDTIDLEFYGLGNSLTWQLAWSAIAFVWLGYWLFKRLFFSRGRMVAAGRGDELITPTDKALGFIMLFIALGVTMGGYIWANNKWPVTLPLQSAREFVEPLPDESNKVEVKLERATYRVPGREMQMKLRVTNTTDQPVRLGEFSTATVRFINSVVGFQDEMTADYPDDLLAEEGLTVDDNAPIAPGETRTIVVKAQDAAWENERLSSLIFDPDSRFGGLLYFYGPDGTRQISDVGGVLVPQFQ